MIVCYLIGRIVGAIVQQVVDTHIADFKSRYPIPSDELPDADDSVADATANGVQI
jgi:hypothetical protein